MRRLRSSILLQREHRMSVRCVRTLHRSRCLYASQHLPHWRHCADGVCNDTGRSVPDDTPCGLDAACRGGLCTCGNAQGFTPAFFSCSSDIDCQTGAVCVDHGDSAFFCKPLCTTDTECEPYRSSFPSIRCAEVTCSNGRAPGIFACNDAPGRLASSYDESRCCSGRDDGGEISANGCSDGTREGLEDTSRFPLIAACGATWPASSLRTSPTGTPCGNSLGECIVPADACGPGWHICARPPYGPSDVSSKVNLSQCMSLSGEFAFAVDAFACEPCSASGFGAACCGDPCVQQNGHCVFPNQTAWFGILDDHYNLCSDIVASYPGFQGVLCCRGS